MTRIKLAYVHQFTDRHGKARHYFRRPGYKRTSLPGLPGSAEFMAAYAAALDQTPKREVAAGRTVAGTINSVAVGYLGCAVFHNLAPISRRHYRGIIERIRREHGDKRVALLERRHVVRMLDAKATTPAAARGFLLCLRALIQYAIDIGLREDFRRLEYESPRARQMDSPIGPKAISPHSRQRIQWAPSPGLLLGCCFTRPSAALTLSAWGASTSAVELSTSASRRPAQHWKSP
jgi:hypothetical protein